MLSYMGWIDHTNTYAMYLEWVKYQEAKENNQQKEAKQWN